MVPWLSLRQAEPRRSLSLLEIGQRIDLSDKKTKDLRSKVGYGPLNRVCGVKSTYELPGTYRRRHP